MRILKTRVKYLLDCSQYIFSCIPPTCKNKWPHQFLPRLMQYCNPFSPFSPSIVHLDLTNARSKEEKSHINLPTVTSTNAPWYFIPASATFEYTYILQADMHGQHDYGFPFLWSHFVSMLLLHDDMEILSRTHFFAYLCKGHTVTLKKKIFLCILPFLPEQADIFTTTGFTTRYIYIFCWWSHAACLLTFYMAPWTRKWKGENISEENQE